MYRTNEVRLETLEAFVTWAEKQLLNGTAATYKPDSYMNVLEEVGTGSGWRSNNMIHVPAEVLNVLKPTWKKSKYGYYTGAKSLKTILKLLGQNTSEIEQRVKAAQAKAQADREALAIKRAQEAIYTASRALVDMIEKHGATAGIDLTRIVREWSKIDL
jgi:hypothetical protein